MPIALFVSCCCSILLCNRVVGCSCEACLMQVLDVDDDTTISCCGFLVSLIKTFFQTLFFSVFFCLEICHAYDFLVWISY